MHPGCKINNWPSINKPRASTSFSFAFIEIIIAQYGILNQYDSLHLDQLFNEALLKFEQKNMYDCSSFGKPHTAIILGRIMYLDKYGPFIEEYDNNSQVRIFLDGVINALGIVDSVEALDIIYNYAKQYRE